MSLNLRPLPPVRPAAAPHPAPRVPGWTLEYAASHDGREANLVVMCHGLGDTCAPFFQLGRQFKLPATCVLSLQAPFPYVRVSLLDRVLIPRV